MKTAFCDYCGSMITVPLDREKAVCEFCGTESAFAAQSEGDPEQVLAAELSRLEAAFHDAYAKGEQARFLENYRRFLILSLRQVPGFENPATLNAHVESMLDSYRDAEKRRLTPSERAPKGPGFEVSQLAALAVILVLGIVAVRLVGGYLLSSGGKGGSLAMTVPAFLVVAALAVLFGLGLYVIRRLKKNARR